MKCAHTWKNTDKWKEEDGIEWSDYKCIFCGAEKMIGIWNKPKEQYKVYYEHMDDNRTTDDSP